ncbi:MAG: hypothetical protein V2A58_11045 [Planctomycetota bacterium]
MRHAALLLSWTIALAALPLLPARAAGPADLTDAARWELAMLGVPAERLADLARLPSNPVRLAVVGQGGVSATLLAPLLASPDALAYHGCKDPNANTHDTQQVRVILELLRPLGVDLRIDVWQPGESFFEVADAFREASLVADVVVTYQSFWGENAAAITAAIRESPRALVISPYVEFQARPTSECPQGSAFKPWDPGSIPHFVTVAPLSKRSGDGAILRPSARDARDSEVISFVAPSFHASGPGGTCPAASVVVAVACYIYASGSPKPSPAAVIALMRETSRIDAAALTSLPPFTDAASQRLAADVKELSSPPDNRPRKLDAPGVLNLKEIHLEIYGRIAGPASGPSPGPR